MKKYLLPESGKFYKANLHCHSNHSDGDLSPAELKAVYMKNGYSIVAFTDHDVMIPHHDLREDNFLPLTAVEYAVNNLNPDKKITDGQACHFNFIALDEDMEIQPFWHRTKFVAKHSEHSRPLVKFDESLPDYVREYSPACISEMMRGGRDGNFFVTYNHPTWSQENFEDYIQYDGMHALEIMNSACIHALGIFEYNDTVYDNILRYGKHIYCVAADDTHSGKEVDETLKSQIARAWVMIKAESLTYKNVSAALKAGHFYSSEGPVINALWYEDGKLCIDCEDAAKIAFVSYPKRGGVFVSKGGVALTHAELDVGNERAFVRIVVENNDGKRAYTHAYFTEDLNSDSKA